MALNNKANDAHARRAVRRGPRDFREGAEPRSAARPRFACLLRPNGPRRAGLPARRVSPRASRVRGNRTRGQSPCLAGGNHVLASLCRRVPGADGQLRSDGYRKSKRSAASVRNIRSLLRPLSANSSCRLDQGTIDADLIAHVREYLQDEENGVKRAYQPAEARRLDRNPRSCREFTRPPSGGRCFFGRRGSKRARVPCLSR